MRRLCNSLLILVVIFQIAIEVGTGKQQ